MINIQGIGLFFLNLIDQQAQLTQYCYMNRKKTVSVPGSYLEGAQEFKGAIKSPGSKGDWLWSEIGNRFF